jgi:hypothetical protein
VSKFTLFALAAVSSVALVASSSASTFAPGKPVTVQMHGVPCSVTASAPVFVSNHSGWVMHYSGGVSCMGGTGMKTLQICDQVQNGSKWFTITGSCLVQGPLPVNPLRLSEQRSAFLGHVYRVHAVGQVDYPTTGGTHGSAVANSRGFAP